VGLRGIPAMPHRKKETGYFAPFPIVPISFSPLSHPIKNLCTGIISDKKNAMFCENLLRNHVLRKSEIWISQQKFEEYLND
jgi:hypothetical protein